MSWKPIETAPKDETTVDLWVKTTDSREFGFRLTNAHYCPEEGNWLINAGGLEGYEELTGAIATHWRPLPEPPEV
jgi:hypothetical protein